MQTLGNTAPTWLWRAEYPSNSAFSALWSYTKELNATDMSALHHSISRRIFPMLCHALPISLHSWHASHEALHTVGQFALALPSQPVGS